MTLDAKAIGAGLLGGLTAGLLSAGSVSGATVLFLLSPLPVIASALAWGPQASIAAAVACFGISAALTSFPGASIVALVIALPAGLMGYLANLARPAEEVGGPEGSLAWYPLSDILLYTALAIAGGFVALGVFHGYGPEFGVQMAARLMDAMREANPDLQFVEGAEQSLARLLTNVLPALQPATWVIVLLGNFYLAGTLVRLSGRLKRPRDDWPTALRMPRLGLALFGAAMLAAFAPGGFGFAASAVAGALAAGFIVSGYAMAHARTRGKPGRAIMLWLAYLATAFLSFPLFAFLIAGLLDTRRQVTVSQGPANPNPKT
ncbi:MAG: DUF2232 domain-containing protein [Notoacmeibacter sp.]|nr:DUF2232 domain-containing protein [Notoacmeibacter sp.]